MYFPNPPFKMPYSPSRKRPNNSIGGMFLWQQLSKLMAVAIHTPRKIDKISKKMCLEKNDLTRNFKQLLLAAAKICCFKSFSWILVKTFSTTTFNEKFSKCGEHIFYNSLKTYSIVKTWGFSTTSMAHLPVSVLPCGYVEIILRNLPEMGASQLHNHPKWSEPPKSFSLHIQHKHQKNCLIKPFFLEEGGTLKGGVGRLTGWPAMIKKTTSQTPKKNTRDPWKFLHHTPAGYVNRR